MAHQTFHLIPGVRLGRLPAKSLSNLTSLLQDNGVDEIEFTATGQLRVSGIAGDQVERLSALLKPFSSQEVRSWIGSLYLCPGHEACKHTIRQSSTIAAKIRELSPGNPLPAKIKIGIAGCNRCCTSPWFRDIGLIAENKGWKLTFGGNGGGRPRIGDEIASALTNDEAIALLHGCLTLYGEYGREKMRTARFMESFGLAWFCEKLKGTVHPTPSFPNR